MLLVLLFLPLLATMSRASTINSESCTPEDGNLLLAALGKAINCVDTILQIHSGSLPFDHSLELRQRYFGNMNTDDFLPVTQNFANVQGNWTNPTFKCLPIDPADLTNLCSSPGTAAYTNRVLVADSFSSPSSPPKKSTTVSICPMLLGHSQAGGTGDPASRPRLMIHEMMHSYADPRTKDIEMPDGSGVAYLEHGARQLAFWSSVLAGRNADNYSLYAEAVCKAVESGEAGDAEGNVDRSEPDEGLRGKIEERVDETAS